MASNVGYEDEDGRRNVSLPVSESIASSQTPVRELAMSSIQKLMIQGIRGFGTGESQRAVIEFGKPLTLITGQNGAGKTTIIECLKYITTGEMPPNSKAGAFVHDPKLMNEREVRGVVKLKFRSINGESVVCHRMLQSTQKIKKVEQKTVDSSLEKINSKGEKVKLTTRCAEIDREMIDLLGVSKPILSHVIFCHQEESAWPLSEGKALKAKFDDIFASTRYTKALENFKKIQQELGAEIRLWKTELHHLLKQKEKADDINKELKETQGKVENSKAEITRISNELEPMETKLRSLNEKYEEVSRMERQITELESSRKELERGQRELESNIDQVFTGSKHELQAKLEQHSSELQNKREELTAIERRHASLVKSTDAMKGRVRECHSEHGRLKTEDKYHKERIQSRNKRVTSLASHHSVVGYSEGPFSAEEVATFLEKMASIKDESEEKTKEDISKLAEKERGVQVELDELRSNLAKLEESVSMKTRTAKTNRDKMEDIRKELADIGSGAAILDGVEEQLANAERECEDYKKEVDVSAMEKELEDLSLEKQGMDKKIMQLQKEQALLSQQASARGALEELRKQKRSVEESYHAQLDSVEPDLLSLFGTMPSEGENVGKKLERLLMDKERELQGVSSRQSSSSAQLTRLQTQHEQLEQQLTDRKKRMAELQGEVSAVVENQDIPYQDMLDSIRSQIDSTSENIATVKGSQSFFRKSLEKLHSSHKCPLCMRGFEEQDSLDNTIRLITTRLNEAIPRMIPRLNDELKSLQEKQQKVQELKPKIEELAKLRSGELAHRQMVLEEKLEKVEEVQATVEELKEKQESLRQELEQIRALQPKVTEVSRLKSHLASQEKSISAEERRLDSMLLGGTQSLRGTQSSRATQASQRSYHSVNRELVETQRSLDELNRRMDHRRQEISETQQTLRQYEDRVHKLREKLLELKSRLQKRESLVSRREELSTQTSVLDREAKTESNRISPVKRKISQVEGKRDKARRAKDEGERAARSKLDSLKSSIDDIKNVSNTIAKYIRDGRDRAMEECEERLTSLTSQLESKTKDRKELDEKMSTLNKELANVKNRERELDDNFRLMVKKDEIAEKSRNVKMLRDQLRSLGVEAYDHEIEQLQVDVDHLRIEKTRFEGHKLGQEDQVRHFQRDLQSELYAGIEERYRDMNIKLKTSELASSDLGKYHRALDRAIMRFHRRKMDDINQIIRELWIKTYKGGDIDTIRICSDDTTQSDTSTVIARRTYNYRVVMVKGSTELDMRGRCSAGQKVLASIIIRLALAETFCLTSGLLALDEPTTNLDADNMEGLAHALADIIKERSKNQKNFQLVIITHDEEFVRLLGQNGFTEYFHKVTKSVGEASRVKKYYF